MRKKTGARPKKPNLSGLEKRNFFVPEEIYKAGQPFRTAMRELEYEIAGLVTRAVGDLKTKSALEVGPGNRPATELHPFGKSVFVDASTAVLRDLKSRDEVHGIKNRNYVLGKIENLRIADLKPPRTGFDVAVMNEVLTHVRPVNRTAVVRKLAQVSKRLFIIDRQITGESLKRQQFHPEEFPAPMKIAKDLLKDGFSVRVAFIPEGAIPFAYCDYFAIYAERSARPSIQKVNSIGKLVG